MRLGYCKYILCVLIGLSSLVGLEPNALLGQSQVADTSQYQTANQTQDLDDSQAKVLNKPPKESRITLLTAAPGQGDVASVFGHSALRVKGVRGSEDILYNFGTYSWDQPNFLLNFLRGRLLYSLSKQRYGPFLNAYHAEQRSITEQTLHLTQEQEDAIISALAKSYRAENRDYLYEFFFDNCTTRLRDIITEGYQGELVWAQSPQRYTFRDLLHQYTASDAWLTFGIDLIVGSRTDRFATMQEEMFLPDYLMSHLNDATDRQGNAIVASEYLVLDFRELEHQRKQKETNWPFYLFGLLLIIEVLIFARVMRNHRVSRSVVWWDRLWYLILGIGGVVLAIMWGLTDHYTTKGNWNIMWLSPLYLCLVGKRRESRLLNSLIIVSLALGALLYLWSGQSGHLAFLPIIGLVLLKTIRNLLLQSRQHTYNTEKREV